MHYGYKSGYLKADLGRAFTALSYDKNDLLSNDSQIDYGFLKLI